MHLPLKRVAEDHNEINQEGVSLNNRGFDFLFRRIDKYLKSADLVFGNLEFPILAPYDSKEFVFNCYPEVLPALKKAGFNFFNLANNHILDQGEEGILSTIRELEKNQLSFIGVNRNKFVSRAGYILTSHNLNIGFIAYTGILNRPWPKKRKGFYINNFYDKEKVCQDIKQIKDKCDYLIMTAHFGEEYQQKPLVKDQDLLKDYVNEGVDLVIGHHPHVVQPIEKIITIDQREAYIFYSLGNFISNQQTPSARFSIVLYTSLSCFNNSLQQRFEVLPIMTLHKKTRSNKKNIQAVSIQEEILFLQKEFKRSQGDKNVKKILSKKIVRLKSKLRALKWILFQDKEFKFIKFN